jgi:hypothetical protein
MLRAFALATALTLVTGCKPLRKIPGLEFSPILLTVEAVIPAARVGKWGPYHDQYVSGPTFVFSTDDAGTATTMGFYLEAISSDQKSVDSFKLTLNKPYLAKAAALVAKLTSLSVGLDEKDAARAWALSALKSAAKEGPASYNFQHIRADISNSTTIELDIQAQERPEP